LDLMEVFMTNSKAQEVYMCLIFLVLIAIFVLLLTGCDTQGPRGYTGSPGTPGTSVSFYTQPATIQECPTGGTDIFIGPSTTSVSTERTNQFQETTICNGAVGATGPTGATGAQGPQGPAGQNGTDATPITFVQFCSGFTPTYPSSFPEYGICVNNVMYGVYSANGGFLAELLPGEYSSDGINASCTFTIGQNCQVSQ